MRAARFDQTGDPDVIRIVQVDDPHPGPGQVRIRVQAAAVNAADWKYRRGRYKAALPLIGGADAAGVVDEIGSDVGGGGGGDPPLRNTPPRAVAQIPPLSGLGAGPARKSGAPGARRGVGP